MMWETQKKWGKRKKGGMNATNNQGNKKEWWEGRSWYKDGKRRKIKISEK